MIRWLGSGVALLGFECDSEWGCRQEPRGEHPRTSHQGEEGETASQREDCDSLTSFPFDLETVSKVGSVDGENAELGTPWSHGLRVLTVVVVSIDRTHLRTGKAAFVHEIQVLALRRIGVETTNDSNSNRRSSIPKR